MFNNLRSLLSVTVEPGGVYVHQAPLSLPFGCVIDASPAVGEDAKTMKLIHDELVSCRASIEADEFGRVRDQVDALIALTGKPEAIE